MRTTTATVPRYQTMHGWVNRILRIDLSDMTVRAEPSERYLPDWLGARGLAVKLCWDEYPDPVPAFDPANPLMVVPGALTGSRSPYSGRTNICALSPQAWPYEWFTRSSIGGHFGGELKRAGYDALIVTGAADTPVRIRIVDDEVSIVAADDVWGLDTMDTIEALESTEGKGVRSLVIGPAGERLSRIAAILTASSSAAGQGGFGGVMGSKRLKAISVAATGAGSGKVSLAHPERVTALSRALARDLTSGPRFFGEDLGKLNEELAQDGNGRASCVACTDACPTPCVAQFHEVPNATGSRKYGGAWFCVAAILLPEPHFAYSEVGKRVYDWQLDFRSGFEMNALSNRYGLNQFDLLVGIAPWLIACQKAGLITELNGEAMDWSSPHFWARLLHDIAYREGIGDALAEGGLAAARKLHLGQDLASTRYPGWGHPGHFDGHDGLWLTYPYWLVSALLWMADTRDPLSTAHGYNRTTNRKGLFAATSDEERAGILAQTRAIGRRVYGDADATDPYSGYRAKAYPAYYHMLRPVIKDCVPVDEIAFPLIRDPEAPDGHRVLRDVSGVGDVEGLSVEYHLFASGTGLDWDERAFERAAKRVVMLERALQVRHWGRDRALDESILPYFERPEVDINPLLGERYGLDREQFAPVLSEFYGYHGWDGNGRPTEEGLRQLGLSDVYGPMMEGATKAAKKRADK